LTTLATLGCDDYVSIKGKVVNDRAEPVEGADVKIGVEGDVRPIATDTTNDKGSYRVSGTYAPSFSSRRLELSVERAGYRKYTELLAENVHLEAHTVTLQRVKGQVLEDERAKERERNITEEDLKLKLEPVSKAIFQ